MEQNLFEPPARVVRTYEKGVGTVIEVKGDCRKIKWDEKASTGQQHSTVNVKKLRAPTPEEDPKPAE